MAGLFKKFFDRRNLINAEYQALVQVPQLACKTEVLRRFAPNELAEVFRSDAVTDAWKKSQSEIETTCVIQDGTSGGVNPGDRRAIWYLIMALKPKAVLEVGTHVGASTTYIASALKALTDHAGECRRLVTVDVEDVNDEHSGAWKRCALSQSPKQMIDRLHCSDLVTFITSPSLAYLDQSQEKFDFIFLDGDHSAATVYQEVPRALNRLTENGVILLHDYFPNNKLLWNGGSLVPGPFAAMSRFQKEGAAMKALPLGELPWPTKLGSNITSLALLTRDR